MTSLHFVLKDLSTRMEVPLIPSQGFSYVEEVRSSTVVTTKTNTEAVEISVWPQPLVSPLTGLAANTVAHIVEERKRLPSRTVSRGRLNTGSVL